MLLLLVWDSLLLLKLLLLILLMLLFSDSLLEQLLHKLLQWVDLLLLDLWVQELRLAFPVVLQLHQK
jgi:hypothetical protein